MAPPAVRVFGKPITQGTPTQRAQAAKNNPNAGGKHDQVLQLVTQLQKEAAGQTSTTCTTYGVIYNATGDTVTYVTEHDWEGHVVGGYPVIIENGQWAFFEHESDPPPLPQGSVAAVVYNIAEITDSMISWNNPFKKGCERKTNTAYCEMNEPGFFTDDQWPRIYLLLKASGTESTAVWPPPPLPPLYTTEVRIDGKGNTPSYCAKFSRVYT